MFAQRLQRYFGLLCLVGLLIIFIVAAFAASAYAQNRWLTIDNIGLSQSRSLQQMLLRLGSSDHHLNSEILAHVKLIRDGGEHPTRFSSVYAFPKSDNPTIINTANKVEQSIKLVNNADKAVKNNDSSVEGASKDQASNDIQAAFNRFTDAHREHNERRSNYLLSFQIFAALVALSGFFAILFWLIFRLGKSDSQLAETLSENETILRTSKDGLFLIDKNHQIGSVQSQTAQQLFAKRKPISGSFLDLIRPLVSAEELLETREYISLLFDCHGRPSLLTDLNPLKQVELKRKSSQGRASSQFLSFDFSRNNNTRSPGILVTVSNITRQVYLKRELNEINDSKREHFENLMSSIVASNDEVSNFYQSSYNALNEINDIMRDEQGAYSDNRHKLKVIYAKIHRLKGNAAVIGMTVVEQSAHSFENRIDVLNARANIDGKALLSLTVLLKQMFSELEFLEQLSAKLGDAQANKASKEQQVLTLTELPEENAQETKPVKKHKLAVFSQEIARRQGKHVNLELHGFQNMRFTSRVAQQVDSLCAQLVRNAIVHGVEAPAIRERRNKPLAGQITVTVKHKDDDYFQLIVRDDGEGLNLKKIRQAAIEQGVISEQRGASLSNTETVRFIFMPELSTRDHADQDAGRGFGLDVVRDDVATMGGTIGVRSSRGLFSQFTVNLPRSLLLSVVA